MKINANYKYTNTDTYFLICSVYFNVIWRFESIIIRHSKSAKKMYTFLWDPLYSGKKDYITFNKKN